MLCFLKVQNIEGELGTDYSNTSSLRPFFTSQIVQVLEFIGKKENLHLPAGFAARIAAQSNRNLRRAILFFETCKVQQ
jgi:DNA polymerase III delta prime subunit